MPVTPQEMFMVEEYKVLTDAIGEEKRAQLRLFARVVIMDLVVAGGFLALMVSSGSVSLAVIAVTATLLVLIAFLVWLYLTEGVRGLDANYRAVNRIRTYFRSRDETGGRHLIGPGAADELAAETYASRIPSRGMAILVVLHAIALGFGWAMLVSENLNISLFFALLAPLVSSLLMMIIEGKARARAIL